MIKLIQNIRRWGVQEESSFKKQTATIVLNDIIIIMLLVQFTIYIQDILNPSPLILIPIIIQIFTAVPLLLNYLNRPMLAKWYCNIGLVMFATAVIVIHGKTYNGPLVYLIFPFTIVLFFEKTWEYIVQFTILIIAYLFSDYYLYNHESTFEEHGTPMHRFGVFLLVAYIAAGTMRIFQKESKQNEQKIQEGLRQLQLKQKQIEKQNHLLEQTNKELERFAYISSHNLKSPIRTIRSFIELIERNIKNGKLENIQQYFDFIKRGSLQMEALVTDTLEFSVLNQQYEIKMETVNLIEVVDFIQQKLSVISEQNLNISYNDLPCIKTNKSFIDVIFQNLIENAIKYNEAPTIEIHISHEDLGDDHLLKFQDNGIGIAPEYHEKIFIMFERLHNDKIYQGTGIGLSMTKRLVEKMNGEIWVKSELGKGATFFVKLPKTIILQNDSEL